MQTLQTSRLKTSRTDSVVESGNNQHSGVTLDARPYYDRQYDHLLTLEEAATGGDCR